MEIRHLKLIREVAQKGSLTQAMDTLYLSQSALSHQLKEAEKQLGTPVLHRVNKKLVLTEAGKIMLEAAESILDQLDHATKTVRKYASGDTGTIRLATECYTCYHFLPALMADFNKEFPKVNIEIHPEATMNPLQMIMEGKLDIAVSYQRYDNPNIRSKELLTDELVALVPADHPWTKKPYVEAADFAEEQVMIHSFPLESVVLFRQVLIPEGVSPKKVIAIQ
ncbi:MAG: LysR family transcriptional regulator, partial [Bacteroidota bacterium]